MEILFKDEHIVVCVKPAGVLSAKDASGKPNMMDMLSDELGLEKVYPIHRLDREVSGVIVFAVSNTAAARLSAEASDHTRFVKEYLALVDGTPSKEQGVFEDLLFKDSSKNKIFVVKNERKGVKKAKLEYLVIKRIGDCTLVRVKLFTGRTHQIRVQFASRKMPIVGDRKYGGRKSQDGIALFSTLLSFSHPVSGEKMIFEKIPEKLL